jgi:hypothetical protein
VHGDGVAWVDLRSDAVDVPTDVAVLLPCRDEEATIGRVVSEFRAALPHATIYVYDNGSTDATASAARTAGATVRYVAAPGKGNVIRRMFTDIEAAYYVVCDGDGTYETAAVVGMLGHAELHHLDMVVGRRVESDDDGGAYRMGHRLGNRIIAGSVRHLFGGGPTDLLSGYRVLSRRYVKTFPATSSGFETETEMTVHAMDLSLLVDEIPTAYSKRPPASQSKLRTIPDGIRITRLILHLLKDYRPLLFFGVLAVACSVAALAVAVLADGPHADRWTLPMAITFALASAALMLAIAGAVADVVGRRAREIKRILFLAVSDRERLIALRAPVAEPAVHALEA